MEKKYCPICGEEMEYRPIEHWTGMRCALLKHTWVCSQRNHKLTLMERPKPDSEVL